MRQDRYRQLSEAEPSIPLFCRPWWLDATAGPENWDVALIEKGRRLQAAMPYVRRRRYGLSFIGQPVLTQHLGPWLRPAIAGYAQELAQQKDLLGGLIAQLPKFDHFFQNWSCTQQNWLPFFWSGFQQTTRYTYTLTLTPGPTALWRSFQENARRETRKAKERYRINIRTDLGVERFYSLNKLTFKRQKMPVPYSLDLLNRIDRACEERDCRRIFFAEDPEGRLHAAAYLVWDENRAYYLMGGGDPALRNSGAGSLCMWEAIQFAATVSKTFDFEGSMLEPVERFFRGFGAIQTPYFSLTKTPSRLLRTGLFARDLFRP